MPPAWSLSTAAFLPLAAPAAQIRVRPGNKPTYSREQIKRLYEHRARGGISDANWSSIERDIIPGIGIRLSEPVGKSRILIDRAPVRDLAIEGLFDRGMLRMPRARAGSIRCLINTATK
jgi:hypothetical protein